MLLPDAAAESKARRTAPRFQTRDIALLRDLFESRVLASGHIASLHFNGSREAAKKRLQKLKAAGLLIERRRRAFEPVVLLLARPGLELLRTEGVIAEYPQFSLPALERRSRVSDLTIRHELEVADVKVAFHRAMSSTETFSIAEFGTWPLLHEFESVRTGRGRSSVIVRPDGFVRIHENEPDGGLSEHTFFLEVDRSTESLDVLVARAGAYAHYFKSGGFAAKNGGDRSAFRDFPFRVLMVFKTAERRNNTTERLLQSNPPIFTQVCLSTMEEVIRDPLGKIWIRPLDYQQATRGTHFDPERGLRAFGYQRQTAREFFVEERVPRTSLLTG